MGVVCWTVLCVKVEDGDNGCGWLSTVECLRLGLLGDERMMQSVFWRREDVHMSFSSIDVAFDTILYAVATRYALPADIASHLRHVSFSSVGTPRRTLGCRDVPDLLFDRGSQCRLQQTACASFGRPLLP